MEPQRSAMHYMYGFVLFEGESENVPTFLGDVLCDPHSKDPELSSEYRHLVI